MRIPRRIKTFEIKHLKLNNFFEKISKMILGEHTDLFTEYLILRLYKVFHLN
jgi:hypothetical protein